MKSFIIALILLAQHTALGADLNSLTKLFVQNYNALYEARMCGRNIERFVDLSLRHKINLDHSYVLKVTGAGFLETSGFYTRQNANRWKMLGYFHYVFVAEGHVFDFDLDEPLVLPLHDYVRLQFTPPFEPFYALGNVEFTTDTLKYWKADKILIQDFINKNSRSEKLALDQIVPISSLKRLKRIR